MTESRQAQYLRILENNGPADTQSDRQACKYLKDMGYADCYLRESNRRHNYGEIEQVLWKGVTSKGQDYIDELRLQLEQSKQKIADRSANHHSQDQQSATQRVVSKAPPVEPKLWHERSTLRVIAIGILVTVIGGLIVAGVMAFF